MFKKKNKNSSPEVIKENSEDAENPQDNGQNGAEEMPGQKSQATPEQKPENDPLRELLQKNAELEDKYLRLRAEFDNYRKRTYKDISEARFSTKLDTILPVLSVLDHFRLAVDASEKNAEFKVLYEGMKIILSEFQRAMDELGIEIIDAKGKQFDPKLHDAVAKEHSDTVAEGKVISQWRCGYALGERILRPCSVVVSSGPEKTSADETQAQPAAPEAAGPGTQENGSNG